MFFWYLVKDQITFEIKQAVCLVSHLCVWIPCFIFWCRMDKNLSYLFLDKESNFTHKAYTQSHKILFLCRLKMYYHCYTLVYCVVLLYQYTRWMYCYYKDKKFKPYNCFTAIFIREKLGKYGENQFKRYSIIAIIGPRMCMASIERLDINDHFCLVFLHMSSNNAVQCVSKRE